MRYNDKGSKVMTVQRVLLDRGYKLPRFGADGHLGDETWDALQQYAGDNGLQWDPEAPSRVINSLISTQSRPTMPAPPGSPSMEVSNIRLIDLRDEQPDPPPPVRGKMKMKIGTDGKVLKRAPSAIDTIVIHQTATPFSATRQAKEAHPDDPHRALAERAKGVACHVMAFKEGFLAWPNPLDWYVYHGNGWNATELGLEIDGNYPGVKGGKTWNGKKPTEVTPDVIRSACAAIELMVIKGRQMGMPIEYIHAHRQSSDTRRDDPGEELWRNVVLGYAVPILGLKVEQGRTIGKGRPVPKEWDPNGVGRY